MLWGRAWINNHSESVMVPNLKFMILIMEVASWKDFVVSITTKTGFAIKVNLHIKSTAEYCSWQHSNFVLRELWFDMHLNNIWRRHIIFGITNIVMFGIYKQFLVFIYQILPRSGTLESKVLEI